MAGKAQRISKLLVANRGEIACRVIRTAQSMGIEAVSVYSDADAKSQHVLMANEAYRIGPAPANQSYLKSEAIIDACKRSGAQAVHPGYGFLSENTEFANMCSDNDIVFIGPPPNAIRDMGIKNTSKRIMEQASVPVIAGYHGDNQQPEVLLKEARNIGFPVMIKAVRGGGGKGMRIAETEQEFMQQLDSAKSESLKAFGNDDMLLEKYIARPRHVEVQVFGDHHGNYLYFYERDCSVQRRHQKIIEEAPAPGISAETRASIGEAACRAAAAVNYVGAGTVEFIMDENEDFYFMEMNTRLQVEHPVTELITGTDLVELQIRVAEGQRLPLTQQEVQLKGHAFEARIYAEDTAGGFLPTAGRIEHLHTPDQLDGTVRLDSGVVLGDEIGVYYDPMICKLIVWGQDRAAALRRLSSALRQFRVSGLPTNRDFLLALAAHPQFASANVHTAFIQQHSQSLMPQLLAGPSDRQLAMAAVALVMGRMGANANANANANASPFAAFRLNHRHCETVRFTAQLQGDQKQQQQQQEAASAIDVKVQLDNDGCYIAEVNDCNIKVQAELSLDNSTVSMIEAGSGERSSFHISVTADGTAANLFIGNRQHTLQLVQPKWHSASGAGAASAAGSGSGVSAPMPGVIERVLVAKGQAVKQGEPLVTLIAMKMEYVIRATCDAVVSRVACAEGDTVPKGLQLVHFEQQEERGQK